ncbi:DUF2510 domain-containing protein [Litorihabitans aurantiacus]|uniref:DUF2510 domain-containing protein n=1 Tax=Litorihabitans aurantiacus TaxID=1930061 RepID=A0AA37XB72_9MICO|nr:DUF2510 domain-containing protein [Litorihabitans aurantiacus]GMA30779.1 hypothetical protein GCM10025875_07710 [Litorihabitans aurantiacus]
MVTKEAGWYPDPQGLSQVRFWDGDGWTDYTQPFAPEEVVRPGPATALADYPYLAGADLRSASGPRTVSTWTPAPVAAPAGVAAGRQRSGLLWWLVGAGVVVVVIIAVAINALIDGDPATGGGGGADPAPSSTASLEPFAPGDAPSGTVPAGGSLTTVLEVEQDGDYLVGATGSSDTLDVEMTITPTGEPEALPFPSDRGYQLSDLLGGSWSDPGYWVWLPAGSYDLVLTERRGEQVDVELQADAAPEVIPVEAGVPANVSIGADSAAVLRVSTDAPVSAVVDVRGEDEDLDGHLSYLSGDRVAAVDDRGPTLAETVGGTEYDPYLELDLEAGVSYLVLEDLYEPTPSFSVSVTFG